MKYEAPQYIVNKQTNKQTNKVQVLIKRYCADIEMHNIPRKKNISYMYTYA